MRANVDDRSTVPPHLAAAVDAADLRRALGPHGAPATIAFRYGIITVTTPSANITVPVTTLSNVMAGVPTAGLRAVDADTLRHALDCYDRQVELSLRPLTVTVTTSNGDATVGRW